MIKLATTMRILKKKNSFVVNVQLSLSEVATKHAQNMGLISSNTNVNFVAIFHNGFVGAILIFVNHVIRNNVLAIMFQERPKISYQNVKGLRNVL